jgi:hypothetical protein
VSLALFVPVSAQQQVPPDPNQAAIKFQVKNFESTLRMAVTRGGQEVATHARQIVPGVELTWLSEVGVSGWWTSDFGYTFDVVIPDIGPSQAWLFRSIQQQPASPPPVKPVAGTAGSPPRTSAATADAIPDRVIASSIVPFDPNKEFSDKVRQALIDALVDYTGALQFKPGQQLQISAGPGPEMVPNPLGPDSRKLILTVKGEDLIAYRQGRLKRDELLARVVESRF